MSRSARVATHDVDGLSVVRRRAAPLAEDPASSPAASPFGDVGPGAGPGTTVLFVHGAMDRAASFGRVMRRMSRCECIAVDRRGYGGSVRAGVARTLSAHADDLERVIEWSGAREVVVVGHSLGGRIALELAARGDQRIRAIAAFEPPAPEWDGTRDRVGGGAIEVGIEQGPDAAGEHFYRRMVGERTWERLRERDRQARRAEGPALLAELVDLRDGPVHLDPGAVQVPVDLGVGQLSSGALRSGAEALHGRIGGSRLVEVTGAGHGAHLTHPDEFARYVSAATRLPRPPQEPGANPFTGGGAANADAPAR